MMQKRGSSRSTKQRLMADSQAAASSKALTNLIDNAYDFLEGSLLELEANPKRSVIDFYTAVELFLKAPLLNEHWTLVVKGHISVGQFRSGNFQSVGLEDAALRLNNVLSQPIASPTMEAFKAVGAHRNRYVHFYVSESDNSTQSIALEQLRAWAGLQRFIQHTWPDIFSPYATRTAAIHSALQRHRAFVREFAELRMPDIAADIAAAIDNGAVIDNCFVCGTKSAAINSHATNHQHKQCLICKHETLGVWLNCPHCEERILIEEDGTSAWCEKCETDISESKLYNVLDTDPTTHHNYYEKQTPASCGECNAYEAVCSYHEQYLCTHCFTLSNLLYSCEWCSANFNTPQEDTNWAGCEHCGGAAGNIKDD